MALCESSVDLTNLFQVGRRTPNLIGRNADQTDLSLADAG